MPRASRSCPVSGCPNLIRFTRHCPEHTQAWSGPRTASSQITSQRRWRELVPKILDRDRYRCRIQYEGICTGRATVVDKEQPASRRPDLAFDPKNLRAACQPCNDHKARTEDRR